MNEDAVAVTPDAVWLEANGWKTLEDDGGLIGHVGPFWLRADHGTARLGFIADTRHRNRGGHVQGGMIAALADRAMGQTVRMANGNQPQVTIQLDMHYIDVMRMGEFIEARCRVVRQARQIAFVEAEIFANGRLAATARGVWKMIRRRTDDSAAAAPALPESRA
ncbi:thioesterase [Agaricicola taiwanensis]|uniref:Thioesterase n=1 Tax=Agaricicola taiwanensis TaxID=591372 RepID=A0A8J3E0L4_9RHOB|nr:PaaI family thioesterase [Agaricicola taiwanensis]GGE54731.1 thioesterase [Agaricicola taiwanensis]